ncbi:MAG: hypothetical protein IJ193_02630 [Bacilli bacterium]|nr:hypothetical protein [Bacilli bacterium]
MNLKFEVNDYVLAWNLLFKSSITENIIESKRRIWKNYKNLYNKVYNDKELMMKDPRNFIPNNDTVYNNIK